MRQNDFLENEWPEDGLNESEAPAEEAESDCGLYAIDTPVSEEKLGEPKSTRKKTTRSTGAILFSDSATTIGCTGCMDIYRSYGLSDGEAEESREELTVSPYPEPYEAFLEKCRAEALFAAWDSLNYREQEMLAAHLGFCPECFSVLERIGPSEKWYDCVPRKKLPYDDISVSHGLSSPDSAQRICEQALRKLRMIFMIL